MSKYFFSLVATPPIKYSFRKKMSLLGWIPQEILIIKEAFPTYITSRTYPPPEKIKEFIEKISINE